MATSGRRMSPLRSSSMHSMSGVVTPRGSIPPHDSCRRRYRRRLVHFQGPSHRRHLRSRPRRVYLDDLLHDSGGIGPLGYPIQVGCGSPRMVAAVSTEIRDASVQPQTLHLVGQRDRSRPIARVPHRMCRRMGRCDGAAPRCASRDAQSQRLPRRAGSETDLPRLRRDPPARPYPRHATPTFSFFFAYSKLRSRSIRCCSFSASSITAGFFPATSSMTIAPMNGWPLLASATKRANSHAGIFGNAFQKSASRYGSNRGGRPVIISSCIDESGHSLRNCRTKPTRSTLPSPSATHCPAAPRGCSNTTESRTCVVITYGASVSSVTKGSSTHQIALCLRCVPGFLVVFCTGIHTFAVGTAALQRVGGAGCGQSAGSPLHQRNVYHGPECLCAAQPTGRLLWPQECSAHPLSGQRPLPTVRVGASARPGFGHRLGVSAHVFAEPQPDRTLLALGQEAMSERKVSSGLRDDENRHPPDHRLGPSRACCGPRLVAHLEFPTVPTNDSNKLNRVQYTWPITTLPKP